MSIVPGSRPPTYSSQGVTRAVTSSSRSERQVERMGRRGFDMQCCIHVMYILSQQHTNRRSESLADRCLHAHRGTPCELLEALGGASTERLGASARPEGGSRL